MAVTKQQQEGGASWIPADSEHLVVPGAVMLSSVQRRCCRAHPPAHVRYRAPVQMLSFPPKKRVGRDLGNRVTLLDTNHALKTYCLAGRRGSQL